VSSSDNDRRGWAGCGISSKLDIRQVYPGLQRLFLRLTSFSTSWAAKKDPGNRIDCDGRDDATHYS